MMAAQMRDTDEPATKKTKAETAKMVLPSSMIVDFVGEDGVRAGGSSEGTIDLPLSSTSKQLEQLVNSLLQVKIKIPKPSFPMREHYQHFNALLYASCYQKSCHHRTSQGFPMLSM